MELANLDPDEYVAIVEAAGRYIDRWRHLEELLAQLLEVNHATLRAQLAAGGVKEHQLPKPLHYRRPWEADKPKPRAATRAEIAARIPRR